MILTIGHMRDIFHAVQGNVTKFHKEICEVTGRDVASVNKSSLYMKAKQINREHVRLNKYTNKAKLNQFLKEKFTFPKVRKSTKEKNNAETEHKKIIDNLLTKVEALKTKLRELRMHHINQKLKRNQVTIERLRNQIRIKKSQTKKPVIMEDKGTQCNLTKTVMENLKSEIANLQSEVLEDREKSNVLDFRGEGRGKPYSGNLREIYYALRSKNIPLEHVGDVIQTVLSLVDMEVQDLPSIATASRLTSELGIVSREQMNETLCNSESITMHRDATTKKGRHFYGVEFTTDNQTFTAGIREVHDGKSSTYVDCTKEIISDISSPEVLKKVSNFMTDRSATEQKVNNILSEEICEGDVNKMPNSFKCAVHPLLQFSDVCTKKIFAIEKEKHVKIESNKNESVTHLLLRCVSKLFYKDGSGDPLLTTAYLKNAIGIKNIPIMNFNGNRFNLLFHNAAGTFFLHKHITSYLTNSKTSLNFIQNFIVTALQSHTILCILRALGIICKTVTQPYWDYAQSGVCSAIEMGSIYSRLVDILQSATETPELLLQNNIRFFYGPQLQEDDCVSKSLFSADSTDEETCSYIKQLSLAILEKCKHLFKDFFGDGVQSFPSAVDIQRAKVMSSRQYYC